ncbi:MAG: penicillin-binding protein 1A [Casimicrobiaceae bacterium]
MRFVARLAGIVGGIVVVAMLLGAFAAMLLYNSLPSLDPLVHYRPHLPLRVFTADGVLIGEFGEERRAPVKFADIPTRLRDAIIAAEDDRFYQHHGIDYAGIVRAAIADLRSNTSLQGASTITMQVARNFYLTREKTLARKIREALLALKIDHELTKDQILELYVNQIYLGERAYGFAAAADIYFGKPLDQLTLAEVGILAGLPKAPSRDNPIANPARAKERQRYVLRRMHELKYITDSELGAATAEPLQLRPRRADFAVRAAYVAEMVRQVVFDTYQEGAYSLGLSVYTTIRSADQDIAERALRDGVLEYDRRHGYRGPEDHVELPADAAVAAGIIARALRARDEVNGLVPAIVLEAGQKALEASLQGAQVIEVRDGLEWISRPARNRAGPRHRLRRGDVIRVERGDKGQWQLTQLPEVEAALVAIDPHDGAILALVGGFDQSQNNFNHVTQALRQPGSSFKPFIYSAALEKGFTPATIIDDVPTTFQSMATGLRPWTPGNYERDYLGPISMRTALAKSRNVASARILQSIGVSYARDYVERFGFSPAEVPPYLSMVLGVGSVPPLKMATAYAVFANGGHRVTPFLFTRVLDRDGKALLETPSPGQATHGPLIIDPRNAFLMTSMMQDVIRRGTAARAMQLGRTDLAGKTGTTENFTDAWFDGFNSSVVAVTWMGFDKPRSLGRNEVGARAALPIWMKFMGGVLKNSPPQTLAMPEGIAQVAIDPRSGLPTVDGAGTTKEYFYTESLPPPEIRPARPQHAPDSSLRPL